MTDVAELWDAVDKWRTTPCSFPLTVPAHRVAAEDYCDGENHLENCATEIARQEMLAVHNRSKPDR
jgi:hypothetical protein